MTVSQRILLLAALLVLVGEGILEAAFALPRGRALKALQLRADVLSTELRRLTEETAVTNRGLQPVQEEIARLSAPPDIELDAALSAWLARVVRLRKRAAERSDEAIPEFELLTEKDWLDVARETIVAGDLTFETQPDLWLQLRLVQLRDRARFELASKLRDALIRFVNAHDGQLPDEVSQLAPFTAPSINPAIFGRYEMLQHGNLADVPRNDWLLDETTAIDKKADSRLYLARFSTGFASFNDIRPPELRVALQSYLAANGGQFPTVPAQLLPFFQREPSPEQRKAFLEKSPADFRPEQLQKLLPAK